MDIDRINAICAEIEDGMKSFGKNREWDFTAAVRPADTDERTGGQKSEKVSKIERLLADFNASNLNGTGGFNASNLNGTAKTGYQSVTGSGGEISGDHTGGPVTDGFNASNLFIPETGVFEKTENLSERQAIINQLRDPEEEFQAEKTVPDEKASVTGDFNASNLFMPVTGRSVGNGLDKIRGKGSKEEERMSVCLSGEEEDVCPMCQGVGSSPSISGKESVTVQGVDSSPSISGEESVSENDIVTGKDFLSSVSGKESAAGNDTGFSFDSESLTLTCRLTEGETARLRTLSELCTKPNRRKAFLESLTSVYAMISVRCRHFRFWNRDAGMPHLYTQIPCELLESVTARYAKYVTVLESAGPDGLPGMIKTAGHGRTKWNPKTKKPVSGSVMTAAWYRIVSESGYVTGSPTPEMTVRLNPAYRDAVTRLFDGFVTDEDGVVRREVCADPPTPYDMESLAAANTLTGIRSYLLIKDGYGQPVVAEYGKNDSPLLEERRIQSPFHRSHPFIRSFNDRSWRGSFRAFGRPLVEVYDIPSAVFSLMPRMNRLRCDDADRMAVWMKTHDLYTEAAVACGLPGGRDAAKEMLQEWRSTAEEPRPGLRRLDRWMRSMWPGVAERLASYPASRYEIKDGKPRKVSGVQADYCLTETEYMKRVAAEVREAGVMCWTLYDALYVIDTDAEKARAVLDGIDWLIRRPAKGQLIDIQYR